MDSNEKNRQIENNEKANFIMISVILVFISLIFLFVFLKVYGHPIFWIGAPIWIALAFLTFKIPQRNYYRYIFSLSMFLFPHILGSIVEVLEPLKFEAIVYLLSVFSIVVYKKSKQKE